MEELERRDARIHIVDPYIESEYLQKYGEVEKDVYSALEGADAMVLMTAHREFRELELQRAKELMRTPILIDGRRIFEQDGAMELGFTYRGIGAANKK